MHKKKSWSDLIPVVNNNRNGSEISSISSCYKESCIFIEYVFLWVLAYTLCILKLDNIMK